jgi:uncharacterized protein YtpQ (UPF0354 family)
MLVSSVNTKFTDTAIAYLKAALPTDDDSPSVALPFEQSPVFRPFASGFGIFYVVDDSKSYHFVQYRHLAEDGIDAAKLHEIGIRNLTELAAKRKLRVQPHANIFAVLMGGDFEASMILLDQLWDRGFRQFVAGEYANAVPARDILAFCDSTSEQGILELQQLIERVTPGGDHLISANVYVRREGSFLPLNA